MILVTGGTGYIGSHTVVELINDGQEVVIIDDLSNSNEIAIEKIEQITGKKPIFYKGSILDKNLLDEIFQNNNIESVIHFAGFKAVGESVQNPMKYYHNNVIGSIVLIESMIKNNVKKIVFSSSATVYGDGNDVPYSENMPISAINPYGSTKIMVEQILTDVAASTPDFSAMLLRYFNPVGAHPSGLIGEDPKGIPNNLMPYISKVAIGQLDEVQVFGNDYDTPDGTGVRDYIHVVDLAKGHIKALEKQKAGVEICNLGSGKGYSVLEIIKAYEKACGKKLPYKICKRREGDLATSYADINKAKEILDWQAEKGVDEICQDSWRFIKNSI